MSEEEKYEQLRQVCVSYRNEVADLEAKLAESEEKLKAMETLREMVNEDSKLNFRRYVDTLAKNEQLEQQLAEKEKELRYKTAECEKWKTDYENCSELEKMMTKERQYCLDNWRASDQDKISFCIEQLEKLKKTDVVCMNRNGNVYILGSSLNEAIDNQIEELKKGE